VFIKDFFATFGDEFPVASVLFERRFPTLIGRQNNRQNRRGITVHMKVRLLLSVSILLSAVAICFAVTDALSAIPEGQREALSNRLGLYVGAYRARDWAKLYELVSTVGRGGASKQDFVSAMKAEHGTDFAQMPDLLSFTPSKTDKISDGFNIYGCGKAQREGMKFNGIVVMHVVYEHDAWSFTGWSFTQFPNEPCKALEQPNWAATSRFDFAQPMEEVIHYKSSGTPFHVDPPK
jgi:hypothetical protein